MQRDRKRCRRLCSIALTATMVFATLPIPSFSANAETVLHCRHEHDDSCYEKNAVATGSEANKLACRHEHDENCYEEAFDDGDEELIFDAPVPVASPADAQPALLLAPPDIPSGAEYLAEEINTWSADYADSGIEASAKDNKVTVTGEAHSNTTLELVIPKDVTVEWRADLTGSALYVVSIEIESEENTVFQMAGGSITSGNSADKSAAIYNNNDGTNIFVSGGRITGGDSDNPDNVTRGMENYTRNTVTISGGIISSGSGNGNCGFLNRLGTVKIEGGTIIGDGGMNAGMLCYYSDTSISGGTVIGGDGEGSYAIYNERSNLTVFGGRVVNFDGYAIFSHDPDKAASVRIIGSSVIFGKDPVSLGSTIAQNPDNFTRGEPILEGNAAVITWTGSQTEYESGKSEDLTAAPDKVTAKWSKNGGKDGISYEAGGSNKGFIEVSGVTVTEAVKSLTSIAVSTGPKKTVYTEGENFDRTGMVVTANYADGSAKVVTGYTVSPSGALKVNDTSVTVTYTENGVTKTAAQAITVKATAITSYTVTFDANGGSVTPAAGITGADGTLASLPIPVRSGNYRFDGWFTAKTGGTKVTADTVFTKDSTIYAHWTNTGDSGSTGGAGGSTGGSGGSSGGSGGSSGGSGGGSGGSGGGSGGSGGGSGSAGGPDAAGGGQKESLPKNYTGETKIINNVKVPSYVEEVVWKAMEDGRWRLGRADGSEYVNTWVAAYNPYADLSAGQQAFDWFLFDAAGYMVTGWYTDGSGNTYYLNPLSDNTKGRMMTGWVVIDGKHYYFNENPDGTRGRMYRDTFTPDGYRVDGQGVWDGKEK